MLYKGSGAIQPANFVWKQGRELVSGTLNNKNFSYSYDTNGMRYNKVVDNKRTEYYLDGTKILGENRIGHGGVILYIYDQTGIAGMIYNGSYYYYEKNILGDVVAVLDINNNEVASYTYDAWGNVISQSGSMADKNPIRYRSYYYDTETGFYYLQSRYYDPSIRRFINADDHSIIGILSQTAGEINLYAYCGNNPVMYTDESGQSWKSFWNGINGKIAGTILVVVGIVALSIATAGIGTAVAGALGGGFMAAVVGGAVGGAISGAIFGVGISIASQGIANGYSNIDYGKVAVEGLIGMASGMATGALFAGIGRVLGLLGKTKWAQRAIDKFDDLSRNYMFGSKSGNFTFFRNGKSFRLEASLQHGLHYHSIKAGTTAPQWKRLFKLTNAFAGFVGGSIGNAIY